MSSQAPPARAEFSLPEPGSGFQKIESWFDIVALEHRVLDFWQQTQAFETLARQNRNRPPYSFLDGPITANNPMGVHHAWGRTLKDAFQRYWAMNGRQLRYQNGFDCQGLWVEVEVEKELGLTTKRDVEAYGIDRFVEACKARVRKYAKRQTEQSVRLGMWMDWDNSYFTMAEENNFTIWSFLKKCHQRGKLYRGTDVMPWSGRSGSAYSQMEVIEGRRLVAHTAMFVRFPLRERPGENLLVWTTTPWTLTSNVAAAVNVELEYLKLREKRSGELYYFAAENLNFQRLERQFREKKEWVNGVAKLRSLAQIFNERGGFEIEGRVRGAQLVGLTYDGPFDDLTAQEIVGGFPFTDKQIKLSAKAAHRVIDGGRDAHGSPVVTAGEGSGIVHIAPGCGDIDHEIGRRLALPMVAPLDESARFLDKFGWLSGKHAVEAETVTAIEKDLREKGLLVASERYPHVYPHCWRTGDELVFRLVDEWYINMDWREEIKRVVQEVNWIPPWGRERELEWLSNMRDWMISKKRFWGLALPIWRCAQCEGFDVIGSRQELRDRAIEGWDAFDGHTPHRPWIDAVKIACSACGATASRVADVGNPWLDAGIVPYSTTHYNDDRAHWKKWIPADLVLECFPGQFRNWFYALLSMSTMMEQIAPFRTLLGHALVRDEHGKEMHKSTGNAIWFDDAAETAGADTMRWLYVRQEPTANLNFGYGPLREVRGKFLNTLWNTFAFYVNYARLADYRPDAESQIPFAELVEFDRWILSEVQQTVETCRNSAEAHDLRGAARAIETFVEDLSGWYIRHNRRRFWKTEDDADLQAALQTLGQCIEVVVRLAAPLIPFVTEGMYQHLVSAIDASAPRSVHHTAYPQADPELIDQPLTERMRAVKRITSLALSAREAKKIKVRQPLSLLRIGPRDNIEREAIARFEQMLLDDLNVKCVQIADAGEKSPLQYRVSANYKSLGPRLGQQMKVVAKAIDSEADALLRRWQEGADDFTVQVGEASVSLTRDDLNVRSISPEGQSAAEDRGTWLSFDTTLTEALLVEGTMRDLLRRLQVLRKDIGLEIEDRIHLRWSSDSARLRQVFADWGDFVRAELLCRSIDEVQQGEAKKTIKLGAETIAVSIEKA